MKRTTLNFIIALISFIDLLCMVVTGMIMMYVLPPGTGGGGFRGGRGAGAEVLLSLSRHQWGKIHYCLALVFIVLMTAHVLLHWEWIKSYFKSMFGCSQQTETLSTGGCAERDVGKTLK